MQVHYSKKNLPYTGAELSALFAYKNFDIQGNSVIAFCGPCQVDKHLVDQEDVKAKAFIRSDSMVHFIGEKFNLGLEEGILRQRLYINIIKETLETLKPNLKIIRNGDDLFINHGKLTVSIATLSPVSTMIHVGVNISSKNTPVKTSSLNDLKIKPEKFIKEVLKRIYAEEADLTMARAKVRGVS